ANALPKATSGRSRISSAALSHSSRPLSMMSSYCSRAAPPSSSAAARLARAPLDRSLRTCSVPLRRCSPAALAAPRSASLPSRAACFRCPPASLRWPFMFSLPPVPPALVVSADVPPVPVEVGFWPVAIGSVVLMKGAPVDSSGGRSCSSHRQDAAPVAAHDLQNQLCGRLCEAGAEAAQVGEAARAGGGHHVARAQATAGGAAVRLHRLDQHPGQAGLAQALGQLGEGRPGQPG